MGVGWEPNVSGVGSGLGPSSERVGSGDGSGLGACWEWWCDG